MKKITFENAKNGSLTCSSNGKYLHSKYNPEHEAENFVQNINFDFLPECILITEPALSYSAKKMKEKFPSAKLIAIRYCHEFDSFNTNFDYVFYASTEKEIIELQNKLFQSLGETKLLSTGFIQWLPSSNAFSETNNKVWEKIKETLNIAKASLFTNGFFSKKWFLNAIRLIIFSNNFFILKKTENPIVIAASGPSLQSSIPLLKENRTKFHLIALSSAILPLIKNSIIPDLALSTDGGFWAKKHLSILKKHPEIPLAIATEGNADTIILKNSKIVPLNYSDGFSKKLFNFLQLKTDNAERNGTVSGTAVNFAENLTNSKIFICGLDLCSSKGYQHTMPNALETFNKQFDFRTSSQETRIVKSIFNSESLKIYENWFSDSKRNFTNKVFRLSNNFSFKNNLNTIKDVNFDFFKNFANKKINTKFELENIDFNKKNAKNKIELFIENFSSTEEWLKEFFPTEFFSMNHKKEETEKNIINNEIKTKNVYFIKKLKNLVEKWYTKVSKFQKTDKKFQFF